MQIVQAQQGELEGLRQLVKELEAQLGTRGGGNVTANTVPAQPLGVFSGMGDINLGRKFLPMTPNSHAERIG